MKKWNLPAFCVLLVMCLGLNYLAVTVAGAFNLPLWLDSFGTVIAAYMGGPFIGAMTGLTTNLLFHIISGDNWIYAIVGIWIGLCVGFVSMRKKRRMSLFEALTLSGIVGLGCTAIATPLSLFLNNGSTGNVWGDSVMSFLMESGFARVPSLVIGHLYQIESHV